MNSTYNKSKNYHVKHEKNAESITSIIESAVEAEHAGNPKKAIELYAKTDVRDEVPFNLAKKCGLVNDFIDIYETAGKFDIAIKAAKTEGLSSKLKELYSKAANTYEKSGDLEKAATMAENAGLFKKAIELNMKLKHFNHAAQIAEKLGMAKEAKNLYEKSIEGYIEKENYEAAAMVAEHLDQNKRAEEIRKKSWLSKK